MAPRVRFAPSPTGPMHIGSARTALFNWLFSKKDGGKFILRIEDTDKERSKKEFEEDILSGLTWLGLSWDEFYRVSDRTSIYQEYLEKLLAQGKAYYCFCTEEELEAERESMMAEGLSPKYSGRCRSLSEAEVKEKFLKKMPSVIRFKVPETKVSFTDIVRGKIEFNTALIGDMVIAKSLTEPLYNFAVVIDDALMEITHVIRGEDHLSNTPKQIVLDAAFGFAVPEFAHLPIILNPDRSKMSKRFSDTALRDYINAGYLKEAVINFLAFLGWHPKDDREVMMVDELIKEFDIKRVQKAGAVFNIEKLNWLNGHYLGRLTFQEFREVAKDFLPKDWQLNEAMFDSIRGRLKNFSELSDLVKFYFQLPQFEAELLRFKEMNPRQIADNLEKSESLVKKLSEEDFKTSNLEKVFYEEIGDASRGEMLWPLRVALSGQQASPGPFEIMAALGKEETLKRIKFAIDKAKHA